MSKGPFILNSVHGICLPVKDIKKTLKFYRDELGFVPRVEKDGKFRLTLNLFSIYPVEEEGSICSFKIFLKLSPFQFKFMGKALKDTDFFLKGPLDKGDRQIFQIKDPDGHMLELVSFCTKEELDKDAGPFRTIRPGDRHSQDKWERFYASTPIERMPWYSEILDEELEYYLSRFAPLPGRMLELGCGAGNQAARLAAIGYEVIGVDIAPDAIKYAKRAFEGLNPRLKFEVRDVVNSLSGLGTFDYAFDRGCFHTLSPEQRERYVENVKNCLEKGGILFLKTFSKKEPGTWGPYRFDGKELEEYFKNAFILLEQEETHFNGTLGQKPKGIVSIFQKINKV